MKTAKPDLQKVFVSANRPEKARESKMTQAEILARALERKEAAMIDQLKVYARKAFHHHDKDDSGVLNEAESQVREPATTGSGRVRERARGRVNSLCSPRKQCAVPLVDAERDIWFQPRSLTVRGERRSCFRTTSTCLCNFKGRMESRLPALRKPQSSRNVSKRQEKTSARRWKRNSKPM